MKSEGERFTEFDVPSDIVEAARKIDLWMKKNGTDTWELMDICSRNHAYKLRSCLYDKDVFVGNYKKDSGIL